MGVSKLEEEMEHFKHENCTKAIMRHLYPSAFRNGLTYFLISCDLES
jgi:hypothetical protein